MVGLRHGECVPVEGVAAATSAILSSSRTRVSSQAASRHASQRSRFDAK